ncbi:hypothetical protein P280DRAFT_517624 [Massarina eburnea CBS 473.64]|uniref:Uncharacterized protein n=1 Tax=Massarina eburnea CBS 473.64 TaxID=1395130 RepID=A0A6A6S1H6_9PLEO|nr:hypothetical protein P280DRAFT_517624 [Massarina eburnea CBS 473.64]
MPPKPKPVYLEARPDQTLLLDGLNSDVLAIIVELVFDIDWRVSIFYRYCWGFRVHTSALNLSLVNKRLRAACIWKLFRNVLRRDASMCQLNQGIKDIIHNSAILSAVRTCELSMSSQFDITLFMLVLPTVLAAMEGLQKLSITHMKSTDEDFSGMNVKFPVSPPVLSSVTSLRIQSFGECNLLIEACLNTETPILREYSDIYEHVDLDRLI